MRKLLADACLYQNHFTYNCFHAIGKARNSSIAVPVSASQPFVSRTCAHLRSVRKLPERLKENYAYAAVANQTKETARAFSIPVLVYHHGSPAAIRFFTWLHSYADRAPWFCCHHNVDPTNNQYDLEAAIRRMIDIHIRTIVACKRMYYSSISATVWRDNIFSLLSSSSASPLG
jgi:hypothetical protein